MDDAAFHSAPNGSSPGYRVFGSEESAYSDKLRMYLRFKGARFEWVLRTASSEVQLQSLSRFRTLPVLVTPSGHAAHGTRQMIEALEADLSDPPARPPVDSAIFVIAAVMEDYADSWLTRGVMHYRWTGRKDSRLAAQRAVSSYYPLGQDDAGVAIDRDECARLALERMGSELVAVGLEAEISTGIETSFRRAVRLFEASLQRRPFLFGARPSTADFAVAAQIRQALKDPTPCQMINKVAPALKEWAMQTVENALIGGAEFASVEEITEDMREFFKKEMCSAYLPWSQANLRAYNEGQEQVEVKIGRKVVHTRCIHSAAHSFAETIRKVGVCRSQSAIDFLKASGALSYLT